MYKSMYVCICACIIYAGMYVSKYPFVCMFLSKIHEYMCVFIYMYAGKHAWVKLLLYNSLYCFNIILNQDMLSSWLPPDLKENVIFTKPYLSEIASKYVQRRLDTGTKGGWHPQGKRTILISMNCVPPCSMIWDGTIVEWQQQSIAQDGRQGCLVGPHLRCRESGLYLGSCWDG